MSVTVQGKTAIELQELESRKTSVIRHDQWRGSRTCLLIQEHENVYLLVQEILHLAAQKSRHHQAH